MHQLGGEIEAIVGSGQVAARHVGRVLLGLYFLIPGITKITGWTQMSAYMADHGVPLIPLLLALTIVLQIGGGVSLMAGYR